MDWHARPEDERGEPEHAGAAVSLGAGKSSITRDALPAYIAEMKDAKQPHRVLCLVPTHRLSAETHEKMQRAGINAEVYRGRDADDPYAPGKKMCIEDTGAVQDAIDLGADVEKSVCGDPATGHACPFHGVCGFQLQKARVARADVVIAAQQGGFSTLPKILTANVGLVIFDEAWWRSGLLTNRELRLSSFTDDVLSYPVLYDPDAHALNKRKGKRRQLPSEMETSALHEWCSRVERAFGQIPLGGFPTRAAVEKAGLTVEDCKEARKLEWRRQRLEALRPGMSTEERKEAKAAAAVNATLSRRVAVWSALIELLSGDQAETGRLQIAKVMD